MFLHIKRLTIFLILSVSLCACSTLRITERVLSNGQRVAAVENTGDGITPPATVLLLTPGEYQPVAGGTGAAVIPSALTGAVGSVALGGLSIAAAHVGEKSGPTIVNNVEGSMAIAKSQSKSTGGKNVNNIVVNPTMVNATSVKVEH